MISVLRTAVLLLLTMTVLTGVVYPLAVTLVAQVIFPHRANGSLIRVDDKVVGSELIGQAFADARSFWNRPSATTPAYNGGASSGSNLGPTNPDLLKAVAERVEALKQAHPEQTGPVPADLVMASGSGLDPHITPAAARYQAKRVADARSMPLEFVLAEINAATEGRAFGVLGEPRVNVLKLNLSLDRKSRGVP